MVVAAQPDSGTFVASLANNAARTSADADRAGGRRRVAGPRPSASSTRRSRSRRAGFVNLADEGGITVSGDFEAGDFVELTLTFANGDSVTMNVPVVSACDVYSACDDVTEGLEFISERDRRVRAAGSPARTPTTAARSGADDRVTHTLVLLRHGESDWNAENLFTGWVDVPLSDKGRAEAEHGGVLLKEAGLPPDVVHTSLLRRAITTAGIALDVADRHWIPVRRSWRLNERHYGALQGKNKKQTLEQYGEEQFMLWRRSFDVPPPPIEDDSEFSQAGLPQYADLGDELPRTECLKDVIARFLPYWESDITADLRGRARPC